MPMSILPMDRPCNLGQDISFNIPVAQFSTSVKWSGDAGNPRHTWLKYLWRLERTAERYLINRVIK